MKLCTIPSHHHGRKLMRGEVECITRGNGMHLFTGRIVCLQGDRVPLYCCAKCGVVAAYYRCNGDDKL